MCIDNVYVVAPEGRDKANSEENPSRRLYNCTYEIGLIPGNKALIWVVGTAQKIWTLVFHSKMLRDFAGSVQWCNLFFACFYF